MNSFWRKIIIVIAVKPKQLRNLQRNIKEDKKIIICPKLLSLTLQSLAYFGSYVLYIKKKLIVRIVHGSKQQELHFMYIQFFYHQLF